jgi:hypothetical protein
MYEQEICEFGLFTCLTDVGRAVGGLEEEVWIGSSTANIADEMSHFSL